MTNVSPVTKFETRPDPIEAIADFTRGFSLEATRPSANDVAALADIARPGTRVYLSAVPTRPAEETIVAAVDPVHLARRRGVVGRELVDKGNQRQLIRIREEEAADAGGRRAQLGVRLDLVQPAADRSARDIRCNR